MKQALWVDFGKVPTWLQCFREGGQSKKRCRGNLDMVRPCLGNRPWLLADFGDKLARNSWIFIPPISYLLAIGCGPIWEKALASRDDVSSAEGNPEPSEMLTEAWQQSISCGHRPFLKEGPAECVSDLSQKNSGLIHWQSSKLIMRSLGSGSQSF